MPPRDMLDRIHWSKLADIREKYSVCILCKSQVANLSMEFGNSHRKDC